MTAGGAEHGPDLEGLRAFVREGDRNRARFFVGREAQIRDIEQVCADAFAGFRAGRPLAGTTRLIQGAPGAGKTALLSHMDDVFSSAREPGGLWSRLFGRAPNRSTQPMTLLIERTALANPADAALRIAECLDSGRAQQLRQTLGRSVGANVGAAIGATVATAPSPPSFAELRRLFPPQDWKRPLCLMVDEVQNLESDEAGTLENLHLATAGLPIVPVLAGLANARDVLARRGISRLNEDGVHTLGRLETGEPAEAVQRMLNAYGVETAGVDTERWAARLEEHSDGWPQHLQNAMRSLAEVLFEANGVLASVDEATVSARSLERRIRAYRARRSPRMQEAVFLLARVMAAVPDTGLRLNEAVGVIGSRAGQGCGWSLPEGMSPRDFLDHLVHRGALQSGEDDRLVCPIPSFRHFLMEEAAHALADGDANDFDTTAFVDEVMPELEALSPGPQPLQ